MKVPTVTYLDADSVVTEFRVYEYNIYKSMCVCVQIIPKSLVYHHLSSAHTPFRTSLNIYI